MTWVYIKLNGFFDNVNNLQPQQLQQVADELTAFDACKDSEQKADTCMTASEQKVITIICVTFTGI